MPYALGVGLVWASLYNITAADFVKIKNTFENAHYGWVQLSLFLGFLSHFLRAYRWNLILNPMGYYPKLSNNLMAVFVAYLVNLGIPRAGEISRALVMKTYEDIPLDKALATIFAERVADVFVFALCILLGFFCQYQVVLDIILSKIPKNPYLTLGSILLLGWVGLWFFKKIKSSKKGIFFKVHLFLRGFLRGMQSIVQMQKKGLFLLYTFLIWGLYIAMFVVMSYAFEATESLSLSAILVCFIVGTFSYALTNAGVGSYPLSIEKILGLYGISKIAGLSLGWLMWSSQTLMIILLGALSFGLLPVLNKK